MKLSSISRMAFFVVLAGLCIGAYAAGFDIPAFAAQHQDIMLGMSGLAIGNIDLVTKSLDTFADKVDGFRKHNAELADRVLMLEQRGGSVALEPTTKGDSLGDLVVKQFDENRNLFEKTRNVRLSIKAAGDPVTTVSGRTIIGAGVGSPTGAVLGLQNALPTRMVSGTTSVEYSRYTGYQGEAAVQAAEGDAKAQLRPDHTLITQSAITIAGYTKMSRQALNDSAELKRCIDVTLKRSIGLALNDVLVNGSVTPAFPGFASLAEPWPVSVWPLFLDRMCEQVANMQSLGFNPDTVFMAPNTYLNATLYKATADGHYLVPQYIGVRPNELRGLRVVLGAGITLDKALVIDSTQCELLIVDDFSVEVAYSGDDFTKNMVTVLGEMRVIPVYRSEKSVWYG
jgi:hypothetical protein